MALDDALSLGLITRFGEREIHSRLFHHDVLAGSTCKYILATMEYLHGIEDGVRGGWCWLMLWFLAVQVEWLV